MKVLFGMRMKAVVLGMVVVLSVGVSVGSSYNEDAFKALCEVLRHAEKVLNTTAISDPSKNGLEHALYGRPGGVLRVENGKVSVKGTRKCQSNRGLLCTYYAGGSGTYGCFAESLAGTLLCTCTPGQRGGGGRVFCGLDNLKNGGIWTGAHVESRKGLFQDVWDQVKQKCLHKSEDEKSSGVELSQLEESVKALREQLRQRNQNIFYLGDQIGYNGCGGTSRNDVCAAYHQEKGKDKHSVHIPWADAIKNAIPDLKKALMPKAPEAASVSTTHAPSATTTTEAQTIFPTKPSDPSTTTNTTEQGNTEDGHHTETEAPAHQSSSKSRHRQSTTEGTVATSTAPEETSTMGEPGILDPTAAPLFSPDGADILTPLGLFMAASSFS
ncbi:Variant surface glycoprotein [Trypanosoma congolense IL3000]|uniref:Variant surface glycoprotein n=1 Tax=Trypanosoma congolense (strain IL3000) TaxID=1068625 RepID=F9WGZ2_TRYCI|nr:Variant surface glycoprotein [Trypanosoma congolense IL3000]